MYHTSATIDTLPNFQIFICNGIFPIGYRDVTLVSKTGPLAAAVSKLLLKTLALSNDTNGCPVFNTELFKINFIPKEL